MFSTTTNNFIKYFEIPKGVMYIHFHNNKKVKKHSIILL